MSAAGPFTPYLERYWCGQCGRRLNARPCGPTHAWRFAMWTLRVKGREAQRPKKGRRGR